MKNSMLLSIIIPVYNVEKYIKECLDSVLPQMFEGCEIILVDDGSTDRSGFICDDIAGGRRAVKVIHQNNGGLSSARNTGLKNATGKYVFFLDSDDYIEENALDSIKDLIEHSKVDLIRIYSYSFKADGSIEKSDEFTYKEKGYITDGRTYYEKGLRTKTLTVGAPKYVTAMNLIKDNGFFFMEGMLHEDELWTPILLMSADSVCDSHLRIYYYREDNMTSITHDRSRKTRRAKDRMKISKLLAEYAKDNDKKDFPKAFYDNISAQYMYAVFNGELFHDTFVEKGFPLRNARTWKYITKAILFYVSPSIACFVRGLLDRTTPNGGKRGIHILGNK